MFISSGPLYKMESQTLLLLPLLLVHKAISPSVPVIGQMIESLTTKRPTGTPVLSNTIYRAI